MHMITEFSHGILIALFETRWTLLIIYQVTKLRKDMDGTYLLNHKTRLLV